MRDPDEELVRRVGAGDKRAAAELVRRHLPVVHAAALRITGSRMLAEEVGQSVFSALATRRAVLPAGLPLIVWLHRTARSTALNLLRSENRRRRRERDFAFLHGPDDDPRPCPWDRIAPFLDEVIHQLPDAERTLILRRFFSGESHTAIAGEMNLSPDAVRMRMNRALERMRGLLRRQGIHTTASALALSLPVHAAAPVSATLAASVAAAALPALTAAGGLAFPTLV
ncbi:MAG: sigma-70 family RNA polymerase sigma factor, partial [Verrucomicrobiaceae bacterium]